MNERHFCCQVICFRTERAFQTSHTGHTSGICSHQFGTPKYKWPIAQSARWITHRLTTNCLKATIQASSTCNYKPIRRPLIPESFKSNKSILKEHQTLAMNNPKMRLIYWQHQKEHNKFNKVQNLYYEKYKNTKKYNIVLWKNTKILKKKKRKNMPQIHRWEDLILLIKAICLPNSSTDSMHPYQNPVVSCRNWQAKQPKQSLK